MKQNKASFKIYCYLQAQTTILAVIYQPTASRKNVSGSLGVSPSVFLIRVRKYRYVFFYGIFTVFLLSDRLSCFWLLVLSRAFSFARLLALLARSLGIFLSFHDQTNLQKQLWSSNLQICRIGLTAQLNSSPVLVFTRPIVPCFQTPKKQLLHSGLQSQLKTQSLLCCFHVSCSSEALKLIVTEELNKLFPCLE